MKTFREFKQSASSAPDLLKLLRQNHLAPLDSPPYYVAEVQPAVTFTLRGLLIDTKARALDEHGRPIPGHRAAGADSGGTYVYGNVGGLALALVCRLRAAWTAVRHD